MLQMETSPDNKENVSQQPSDNGAVEVFAKIEETVTVEEHLLAQRDKIIALLRKKSDEMIKGLRQKFEEQMKALEAELAGDKEVESSASNKDAPKYLILSAHTGPYKGKVFKLHIEKGTCMIGRSSGKKFKSPLGVSLPHDSEVSTTHGKFETSGTTVTFTDLKSTNGSHVDGTQVAPDTPVALANGTMLEVGMSKFEVAIEV